MRRIFTTGLMLTMLALSSTASAQSSGEEIRQRVKRGQKVSITDAQGRELRGRIETLTA